MNKASERLAKSFEGTYYWITSEGNGKETFVKCCSNLMTTQLIWYLYSSIYFFLCSVHCFMKTRNLSRQSLNWSVFFKYVSFLYHQLSSSLLGVRAESWRPGYRWLWRSRVLGSGDLDVSAIGPAAPEFGANLSCLQVWKTPGCQRQGKKIRFQG